MTAQGTAVPGPRADALLVGIGNRYRRDDGLGLEVVRHARGLLPPSWQALELQTDIADLVTALAGARAVLLVDALCTGAVPGTVRRFDVSTAPLPASLAAACGHDLSPLLAVELARALHLLPPVVLVYALEGMDFSLGEGLSPVVAEALPHLVEAVMEHIALLEGTRGRRGD